MNNIHITVDDHVLTGTLGETILAIAERGGIEIPTLCHNEQVRHYGACGLCVVEVEGNGKLVRSCSTLASDGMIVHSATPRVVQARKVALELLMSDHDGDCRGPCTLHCPAGTNCQGYLKAIADGDDRRAVEIIKDKLPLPASIGRICPHPCEDACRRQLVEQPISIAYLKSFAADRDLDAQSPYVAPQAADTGKHIAVIGGGPGGLTAAYFLRLKGHAVTVYDAMPKMGGMLRYGIPEYRLPKRVLDAEIAAIERHGIRMIQNHKIDTAEAFDRLREEHDAVIVAIGAWSSTKVSCPGDHLPGVWGGIDLLREIAMGRRPDIGKRVAVIGGGNTAMDACRSAVRLGAEDVYVIYRRTMDEMPAEALEIREAQEEGVKFCFLRTPLEIIEENGKAAAIKLQVMELGEADASGRRAPVAVDGAVEILPVDSVISAIGQKLSGSGFETLEKNRRGNISADENTFITSMAGVFAIGDASNKGADIAIAAIGEGGRAADMVDRYLKGEVLSYHKPYYSTREVTAQMLADRAKEPRTVMPVREAAERRLDFEEINLGLSEAEARREASRCLSCGCHDYDQCQLIRHSHRYDIHPERFSGEKRQKTSDNTLAIIERDQGKCVLCNLCVRVCDEVVGAELLGLVGRGFGTVIKAEFRDSSKLELCKDCKKCADACPTGALRILE